MLYIYITYFFSLVSQHTGRYNKALYRSTFCFDPAVLEMEFKLKNCVCLARTENIVHVLDIEASILGSGYVFPNAISGSVALIL
jgi:hypothetical protein